MICPRHDPRAPLYTCWQRIPDITDPLEILRCQQCAHGRALIATVKRHLDADQETSGAVEAPPQEDIIMDKKTYTVSELADLLGVESKHIYNAKASKGIPSSGSMKRVVVDEMRKRGITFDQVVPAPRVGGKSKKPLSIQSDEGQPERGWQEATMMTAGTRIADVDLCAEWPFDLLVQVVRTKLPVNTSITINN